MIIFIRNIPPITKLSELESFVDSGLKRSFFSPAGIITKTEILALKDKRTQLIEYHGLVYVEPDKAAQQAIKRLNGKIIHNKPVIVREFKIRSWHNDRRENHAQIYDKLHTGKRKGDRRRDMEVVQDVSSLFTSNKMASRKLI